jgi:hypothetical protein
MRAAEAMACGDNAIPAGKSPLSHGIVLSVKPERLS